MKEHEDGIDITPTPVFVVKTHRTDDPKAPQGDGATKVFINVCVHEFVAEPSVKKKLDEEGNEVEGLNVPLSVGPPRPCSDSKGEKAVVYDCIVNQKVVDDANTDDSGTQKNFLCQLAIQYVESKFKCTLDRRYKLPKMTYKHSTEGVVEQQRIRDMSKKPKIEEVGAGGAAKPKKHKAAGQGAKRAMPKPEDKPLDWTLVLEREGGEAEHVPDANALNEPRLRPNGDQAEPMTLPRFMVVHARLTNTPTSPALEAMKVDATPYALTLKLPGHRATQIVLPYAADVDGIEAEFQPHESLVEVRVAVDPTPYDEAPDPGSRPWILRRALEGSDDERGAGRKSVAGVDAATGAGLGGEGASNPEDRFHLRAQRRGYESTTGLQSREEEPVDENEELPEDRFHRADALSSHYINQREGDREEKRKKAEKESAERKQDPDVEYIDTEDFQPGGKYGPPAVDVASKRDELAGVRFEATDDMKRAAGVLASVVKKQQGGRGREEGGGAKEGADTTAEGTGEMRTTAATTDDIAQELSSTVWADLLD